MDPWVPTYPRCPHGRSSHRWGIPLLLRGVLGTDPLDAVTLQPPLSPLGPVGPPLATVVPLWLLPQGPGREGEGQYDTHLVLMTNASGKQWDLPSLGLVGQVSPMHPHSTLGGPSCCPLEAGFPGPGMPHPAPTGSSRGSVDPLVSWRRLLDAPSVHWDPWPPQWPSRNKDRSPM